MANGKGSLEKRDKDGYTWRLIISQGYDKSGKKLRETKTIHVEGRTFESRKKVAERELALFLAETEKSDYVEPSKYTVEDFINKWLEDYAEKNLEDKTYYRYKELLQGRVCEALGHKKLQELKPVHLIQFYNNLTEDGIRKDGKSGGLSNRTIAHYHKAISSMLNDAVQWQLVSSNPAARVEPPKITKKEIPCFNEEQAAIMFEALENEPIKYRAIINLALTTGARRGEILALEWKHINSEKCTVSIQQSVQYIPKDGLTIKQPKNKSSIRLVSVPKSTITLLKEYKITQNAAKANAGDLWNKEKEYVFTTWNGQIMHPDSISSWFPKFIERHNRTIEENKDIPEDEKELYKLPVTNFHSLRHSAATLLINQGLNVRALSNRLGHANTSTTLNIYSHALQSADKQAADIMENILSKTMETQVKKQA